MIRQTRLPVSLPCLIAAVLGGGLASLPAAAEIEEIVVTARKREESLQNVPVAAFAVTSKDIEINGITNLTQAASLTPGLIISQAPNGTGANITLRGVGSGTLNAAFDQAVLINVDNVPVSQGRIIHDSFLDMRQVEVLKGPQALYFGKNSTAGIVTVATNDPGEEFEAIVKLGYELSNDGPFAEAVLSLPLSETVGIRVAGRYSDLNGGRLKNIATSIDGIPTDVDTPKSKSIAGRVTMTFKPNEAFDGTLKVMRTDSEENDINNYAQLTNCQGPGGTPLAIFGLFPSRGDDGCELDRTRSISALNPLVAAGYPKSKGGRPFRNYDSWFGSATMNLRLEQVTLTSVTGYFKYHNNHFGNFDTGTSNTIFGDETDKYRSLSQEVRFASQFDGPVNVSGGVYYEDTNFLMTRSTKLFGSTLDTVACPPGSLAVQFGLCYAPDPATGYTFDWDQRGVTDGKTYSAYAELRWAISPQLELAGGARYSKDKKSSSFRILYANPNSFFAQSLTRDVVLNKFDDSNVSPAVTLTWRPIDTVTLFAAYRTGYKSGGANLGDTSARTDTFGYGSEKATGFEAGAKTLLLDGTLRLNATVYDYDYKDLQVTVFDPVTTTLPVTNAGKLSTTGVEIDALFQPSQIDGLTLKGSIAYNKAKYNDYIAQCYTGQTLNLGCNQLVSGGIGNGQDLAGRPPAQSPKWMVVLGGNYEFGVTEALRAGLSVDSRRTSPYFTNPTLPPLQKSKSFWNLNASARVFTADGRWELALIGSNLLDKIVPINSADNPGTGGGTGSSVGLLADTYVQSITAPRAFTVQVTGRF